MANELLERISHKVGPLPAWAWAAIPAAGYVAWSFYRSSQGEGYITDESVGGAEGTDAADYGLNTGGAYLPGYGTIPNGSSNYPYPQQPDFDNAAWYRQATAYLIGQGVSAIDTITALNAYVYGSPTQITRVQMNALQRAIQRFGPAPETSFLPTVKSGTPHDPPADRVHVPEAPTTASIALRNLSGVVHWGAPAQNGGAPIVGYRVELWVYNAEAKKWQRVTSKLTLAGTRSVQFALRRNHHYLGKIYARNKKGYGKPAQTQSIKTAAPRQRERESA